MNEAQLMEQWAREMGAWALEQFNDLNAAPPRRKADNSWVTEVDETIEKTLRTYIAAAFPNDGIIGEEGGGTASNRGRFWAIDPIDGTGSFVKRLPVWGVSIGLIVDGVPSAGCVFLPVTNECYLVGIEGPPTLNGQPIQAHVDDPFGPQAWMAIPSNAHRRYRIQFPGKTRSLGSIAANICYVARGTATGAFFGNSSLWDIAGALPILMRAGGRFGNLNGQPLTWEQLQRSSSAENPLVVAGEAVFDAVCKTITVIG